MEVEHVCNISYFISVNGMLKPGNVLTKAQEMLKQVSTMAKAGRKICNPPADKSLVSAGWQQGFVSLQCKSLRAVSFLCSFFDRKAYINNNP